MKHWWLILFCTALVMTPWVQAAAPSEQNVRIEKRMMEIAGELRCLVCQNETIAASRADLAIDLRQKISEQLIAGKSEEEIMAYMVERYGDFVRYRPPLKVTTLLLWFGPALLLFTGLIALVMNLRRRSGKVNATPLNDAETQQAEALLRKSDIRT